MTEMNKRIIKRKGEGVQFFGVSDKDLLYNILNSADVFGNVTMGLAIAETKDNIRKHINDADFTINWVSEDEVTMDISELGKAILLIESAKLIDLEEAILQVKDQSDNLVPEPSDEDVLEELSSIIKELKESIK